LQELKVGIINDEIVINPDTEQLKQTQLDLDVAGTESSIVMIEAGANEVTEEKVMDAIYQGHETNQKNR